MSNQIDEKDVLEEQDSSSKNPYSFYEYFYERPAFFITLITAVLSLLSFALSLLIVAFRKKSLQEIISTNEREKLSNPFNIPVSHINFNLNRSRKGTIYRYSSFIALVNYVG